jgi:hypothetical protein
MNSLTALFVRSRDSFSPSIDPSRGSDDESTTGSALGFVASSFEDGVEVAYVEPNVTAHLEEGDPPLAHETPDEVLADSQVLGRARNIQKGAAALNLAFHVQ